MMSNVQFISFYIHLPLLISMKNERSKNSICQKYINDLRHVRKDHVIVNLKIFRCLTNDGASGYKSFYNQ